MLRYQTTDYQKQLYIAKLSDLLTNYVHCELCNSIDNLNTSINEVIGLYIAVLKESAEDFRKKPKRNLKKQEPWFDIELRELKKDKYELLRQFRITQLDSDLQNYKRARNLNRKKADYHKYKLNDSKSFWSKLKNVTNKKERLANSITTERWLDHFESLFNDGTDIENDIGDDINELNIELDEPSDEIEEHIFNSEINDDEIITWWWWC